MQFDLAAEVPRLLRADSRVRDVQLSGSRARGDQGPLSDWDFAVVAAEASAVCTQLPELLSPLEPIALVPDPLSRHLVVAFILEGPVKVDLIFDDDHAPEPPWVPSRESLAAIDAHFWDWTLWLAGKELKENAALVQRELTLMFGYLLEPLGIASPPHSIRDAVMAYMAARAAWEEREGVVVRRTLGDEVRAALAPHGLA